MANLQKTSIFKLGKIIFWKFFLSFFSWNPLLRCPRSQKCSSAQFTLKVERCRAFWNFNDQINGIPPVRHLKNQSDRSNSIGLVPEKLAGLMEFYWSGTWKVSHQIKFDGRTGQSARRCWAARSTYVREVEKLIYNSTGLTQSNQEVRTYI